LGCNDYKDKINSLKWAFFNPQRTQMVDKR
jgi:hypothetical protein